VKTAPLKAPNTLPSTTLRWSMAKPSLLNRCRRPPNPASSPV
jgi:hypothetical protein